MDMVSSYLLEGSSARKNCCAGEPGEITEAGVWQLLPAYQRQRSRLHQGHTGIQRTTEKIFSRGEVKKIAFKIFTKLIYKGIKG